MLNAEMMAYEQHDVRVLLVQVCECQMEGGGGGRWEFRTAGGLNEGAEESGCASCRGSLHNNV